METNRRFKVVCFFEKEINLLGIKKLKNKFKVLLYEFLLHTTRPDTIDQLGYFEVDKTIINIGFKI